MKFKKVFINQLSHEFGSQGNNILNAGGSKNLGWVIEGELLWRSHFGESFAGHVGD